jgi:hypothetical protein
MIVWLASYPRSGNTLCRTILKRSFDVCSYSDVPAEGYLPTKETVGHLELPGPFEEFYSRASDAHELFFVKTHRPPRDRQPAIYVVRDGRATIVSYHRFHASFHPERGQTLAGIILGDDYFGDWTRHYRAWNSSHGERQTLILRYEDLVDRPEASLNRIAEFIAFPGKVRPWVNPFADLQRRCPEFYREGRVEWTPPADWKTAIDDLFRRYHGDLMRELGYGVPDEGPVVLRRGTADSRSYAEEWSRLADLARKLVRERDALAAAAAEKDAEIARLKAAATEKDAEIQSLATAAREKDAEIQSLATAAREKDAEIQSLATAAREKDAEIQSLATAAREKDAEIQSLATAAREKDAEIQSITAEAAARLKIIEQLHRSREYRLGTTLMNPWQVLKEKL